MEIERLTEEETSLILTELFAKIDVPFCKSEPVPKTILIDFFGKPNAGKTATTEKVEQVFRRNKFNCFCPPETAEIYEIRTKTGPSALVSQAQHLVGVEDYVLNLAYHPRLHTVIISRGLIDMLFWYEKGVRDNEYSTIHQDSVRNQIYELLRQDLVDSFIFFTCSVEEAIKREYAKAVTQKRGSKMNEKFLTETHDCYQAVFEHLNVNVPTLPIFQVDTTGLDIKEVTQKVLEYLLPALSERFGVSMDRLLTRSHSLLRKRVAHVAYFEEQLKLKGKPNIKKIEELGWKHVRTTHQADTYLNPNHDSLAVFNASGPVMRIRNEDDIFKFMYKSEAGDRLLSHRRPLTVRISEEDAKQILKQYPEVKKLLKTRDHYELKKDNSDHFFTLHVDRFEDGGVYTEIRVRGSSDATHTQELMRLAKQLGFELTDMVEGNYLTLSLAGKL